MLCYFIQFYKVWPEKQIFVEWYLLKLNNLRSVLGVASKVYRSAEKELKSKIRKFWEPILLFVEVTGEIWYGSFSWISVNVGIFSDKSGFMLKNIIFFSWELLLSKFKLRCSVSNFVFFQNISDYVFKASVNFQISRSLQMLLLLING